MTRTEAVQQLEARMTFYLNSFCNENEDLEDAWAELGYVGDNLGRLMAKAAIAVWESIADVQEYPRTENLLD